MLYTLKIKMNFILFFALKIILVTSHPQYEPSNTYGPYTKGDLPFRTTWPLKIGYQSAIIPNLNDYLALFSNSLVNIQNIQGIDFMEWKYPIYLTRFDIAGEFYKDKNHRPNEFYSSKRFFYENVPKNLEGFHSARPISTERAKDGRDYLKLRYTCYTQFDLFHPEIRDAFHYYLHKMVYANKEQFIIRPRVERYIGLEFLDAVKGEKTTQSTFGENTRPVYFLLVTNLNTPMETKDFWLSGKIDLNFNEHTAKIFICLPKITTIP